MGRKNLEGTININTLVVDYEKFQTRMRDRITTIDDEISKLMEEKTKLENYIGKEK